MTKCKCAICEKEVEGCYATTFNGEIVYACLSCYLKNCEVINTNYEKDENYTKDSDLPQDVVDRLKKINYPIDKFLRDVVYDTNASMREWLHCMEANAGKTSKEHQDLTDKMKKVKHHPSLNEFQRKRIEAYLEAGLSIRDVQRAVKADNFETSDFTIRSIRKKLFQPQEELQS